MQRQAVAQRPREHQSETTKTQRRGLSFTSSESHDPTQHATCRTCHGACARAHIWGYEHSRPDPQNLQIPRTQYPQNTRRGNFTTHALNHCLPPQPCCYGTAHAKGVTTGRERPQPVPQTISCMAISMDARLKSEPSDLWVGFKCQELPTPEVGEWVPKGVVVACRRGWYYFKPPQEPQNAVLRETR